MKSKSQYGQDLWVVDLFKGKRGGFYIEIGAGDGLWISNTLVLEREFGWKGVLVEPTSAYDRLVVNRPASSCVRACVASEEKIVTLFEVADRGQAGIDPQASINTLLSTVRDDLAPSEGGRINEQWGEFRGATQVAAKPLAAILDSCHAPQKIDYFSLDVEGYEYEILRAFPFDRYKICCISVERPPAELHALLRQHGFTIQATLGDDIMYVNAREMGIKYLVRSAVRGVRGRHIPR